MDHVIRNKPADSTVSLYDSDETAWLEQTANLVSQGRWHDVEKEHLCDYLLDMAKRDKREVLSRLVVLLAHRLKWEHQPAKRTVSWQRTMLIQQQELEQLLESGLLRRHATEIFSKAYSKARLRAEVETGLPLERFPEQPSWSLGEVLANTVV